MSQGNKLQGVFDDRLIAAIEDVFKKRRGVYIDQLAKIILRQPGAKTVERAQQAEWVGIVSLSGLRTLVGGRFSNLKEKWLAAGFPLKESKADEKQSYTIVKSAWLELVDWIEGQGFTARLPPDKGSGILFEVQKVKQTR